MNDSTPLIRRLEDEFIGRGARPSDPALAWLCDLLEDWADEWVTKAMFHYRSCEQPFLAYSDVAPLTNCVLQ